MVRPSHPGRDAEHGPGRLPAVVGAATSRPRAVRPGTLRLLWIRHGEVEPRYQRVFGGRLDIGLSERGREQARALAAALEATPLAAVWVSPQRRARLTAEPLLALNGHHPVVEPDLREIDFGDWTGLGWEEVRDRFGVSPYAWLDQVAAGGMPGGEPLAALESRVARVIERVRAAHREGVVALVCHGGIIRLALARLLGVPLPLTAALEVDYGSVSIVDCRERRAILRLLNHTPWHDPLASAT
ncbi:MAG: histidine phosphatase family protein [Verrucomicrobia bacterium]|nr:MAG: histidine phosphatase family protein [Verrucomicrobiota bacterium]